jgi:serine/threonine protein kinase
MTDQSERITPTPPNPTPLSFGNFLVVKQLGRGSHGSVYLVQPLDQQRNYVLKVTNLQFSENLHQEFFVGKAISHFCIVPPLELFKDGDFTCLLFEYIPGITLKEYLERNQLSHREKMKLVRQIIEAIEYLHEFCDIAHLDLKPENILVVDCNGSPMIKIIDFGLACLRNKIPPQIKGTPSFMAPEVPQSESSKEPYDEKADIWSLGKIIVFIMTGENIFLSGNHPIISQLIHIANIAEPPIPAKMKTDATLASALLLCNACLQIKPEFRASAMQLVEMCNSMPEFQTSD